MAARPTRTANGASASRTGDAEAIARLRTIRNVGPATARDLLRLGVGRLEDARDRDPDDLYEALCALDGARHDPCMRDVFAAVVHEANGGPARPWWEFTPERKARDEARKRRRR